MKTIIFIDRDGKEAGRTKHESPPPWIAHKGRRFGFGVGKTDGEWFYYEAESTPNRELSSNENHRT